MLKVYITSYKSLTFYYFYIVVCELQCRWIVKPFQDLQHQQRESLAPIRMMNNKLSLIIILVSIMIAIIGFILSYVGIYESTGDVLLNVGLSFGQLFGLIMLVRNGTILKTIHFKFIVVFISITIVGAMYKIMHWKFADVLLLIGLLGIAFTYLVRFILKKEKGHLDILKVLWVVSSYIGGALIIFHLIPSNLIDVAHGILWITVIDFIITEFNSGRLTWK
jgi:hypothetical protein